jgi:hypothetical protein
MHVHIWCFFGSLTDDGYWLKMISILVGMPSLVQWNVPFKSRMAFVIATEYTFLLDVLFRYEGRIISGSGFILEIAAMMSSIVIFSEAIIEL